MEKDVAVIILNWNGLELLKRFLPSVVESVADSPRAEVYVADNGSTDGSVEWLKAEYPDVEVMELGDNYGFAKGYNMAIGRVHHRYVVLLNSDVETPRGWLEPLIEFMDRNPDAGAVQPKILSWRDKKMFEYAGAAGGLLDKLGYPYCRGRLFDTIEEDMGQYDSAPTEICWASGAALTVRRDVYEAVGGLDEHFFAHMEEIDLCCRIHAAGHKVMVVPQSRVYHVGGASLAQGNPQKTYLNFRNNLLLLYKNLPRKTGRRRLFVRRLYDTLAWGMMMAKCDFRNATAILKAHRDFRRMKKLYTAFPERDVLSSLPGAQRNIVIDYYLKRKKR